MIINKEIDSDHILGNTNLCVFVFLQYLLSSNLFTIIKISADFARFLATILLKFGVAKPFDPRYFRCATKSW